MTKKIFILGVLLVMAFSLSACKESSVKRIERICGIKLPKKIEVIFSHTGEAFTGLAEQYTVFKLKEEPTSFLDSNFSIPDHMHVAVHSGTLSFSDERNPYFEKDFNEYLIKLKTACTSVGRINPIPEKYYPDWEIRYLREANNDAANILYFPDRLELVFLIKGH